MFLDIASNSPYANQRFRGMYRLRLQSRKSADKKTGKLAGA